MKDIPVFEKPMVLLGLSLSLYMLAQIFPALAFAIVEQGTTHTSSIYLMKGAEVTAWGVLGLLFLQVPAIGWLANPLYGLSCVLFVQKKYKGAIAAAFVAIIVGFGGTISAYWLLLPNGSNPNSQLRLTELLPGFWLWLAAPAFLMIIASGFAYWKRKNHLV